MSSGKVLLGLLAGVAAGALAGILLAPNKGSVTRKRISKKGDDYVEGLKEKFNDFLDDIKDNIDVANEKVNEYSENGKSKVEGLKVK
jgi:gas vesicle protein